MKYYHDAVATAERIADGLDKVGKIVGTELGLTQEAETLRKRAKEVREDRFRVLVLGEFKRGKSTLLNALIGKDILPRKVTEATAVVTTIQYSEKEDVEILFTDGTPPTHVDVKTFRDRFEVKVGDAATTEEKDAARDRFSNVDHAVLRYPIEICRNRVELVDSPGLGAHRARTERTQKYLPQSDAVVFVLYCGQFFKQEEQRFLENIILPLGLRNIFFVVNGWNLVADSVLRPEDAEKEYLELEAVIKQSLTPFCVINGVDRSNERIFRVNALGALKARSGSPTDHALLKSSNVPDFEAALQKFLVEDRARTRNENALSALQASISAVRRYAETQAVLATKTIEEIRAQQEALQPKLERLRGIQRHINTYLDSQSLLLQDRLVMSFQQQLKRINDNLPQVASAFDLDELFEGSMLWKAATDWFRDDDNKFAKKVERALEPQVRTYLEEQFLQWHVSIQNEVRAVSIDVEKNLQEEAHEYRRVLTEIEERLGVHGETLQISEMVKQWLGGSLKPGGTAVNLEVQGVGTLMDMSFLVSGIVADILAHMTLAWVPVIGLIVTGIRLYLRESSMRADMRNKIVEGLRAELEKIEPGKSMVIRNSISRDFTALRNKISGTIGSEINLIDASINDLVARKEQHEGSAESESARIRDIACRIQGVLDELSKITNL